MTEADIVARLRKIADAARREDGTDIPLGLEVRAGATEIERLRRELEEARERETLHRADATCAWKEAEALRNERDEARATNERLYFKALRIAHGAHDGQTDKNGQPYILHPLRVSLMGEALDERIVGLLHDVVEDCPEWPLRRLEDEFPPHIVEAVDTLTRKDGEPYQAFIARINGFDLARRVKLNDIADNMDPARTVHLSEKDRDRLSAKYAQALHALAELDGTESEGR